MKDYRLSAFQAFINDSINPDIGWGTQGARLFIAFWPAWMAIIIACISNTFV